MRLPAPTPTSTAVITGASSGIGASMARQLAGRGHNVVLVARREGRMTSLAEELRAAHGIRAEVLCCDLADPEARDALPSRVAELGLTVEVLLNNAGYGSTGPLIQLDAARETGMVRLNCEAIISLTRAFTPGMVDRRCGAILVVASSAAFQPIPNAATYGASKAFALSFAEALHAELSGHGIAVTALCPGPVQTEFTAIAGLDSFDAHVPSFARISPEDCARQALDGLARNQRVVVPRLTIRAAALAGRYVPRSLLLPMMKRVLSGGGGRAMGAGRL